MFFKMKRAFSLKGIYDLWTESKMSIQLLNFILGKTQMNFFRFVDYSLIFK
jgi:hypothetical protein